MEEGDIFDQVKRSALFVVENSQNVKIDREAISKFLLDVPLEKLKSDFNQPTQFPLNFKNLSEEINFRCLIDLLNFGSGFRHLLYTHCDKGAYKFICSGVISMYISGGNITAHYMRSISLSDVSELFRIPLIVETRLNDVMSVPKPGPLKPLIALLQKALNETGEILYTYGYLDFAALVYDTINVEVPRAVNLVEKLVKLFPTFNDTAEYKNKTVKIYKKAQLLACDLYRSLKDRDPLFAFVDLEKMTVFSDNVLPAVLRKFKILTLSDPLVKIIDGREILPRGNEEVELRLCAVHACELIVSHARQEGKNLNSSELDYYLWVKGKDNGLRNLERHYTQDTYFY